MRNKWYWSVPVGGNVRNEVLGTVGLIQLVEVRNKQLIGRLLILLRSPSGMQQSRPASLKVAAAARRKLGK